MFKTERIDVGGKRFILRPSKALFLNSGWATHYLREYKEEREEGVIIKSVGLVNGTRRTPFKAYGIAEGSRVTIPLHLLELEEIEDV